MEAMNFAAGTILNFFVSSNRCFYKYVILNTWKGARVKLARFWVSGCLEVSQCVTLAFKGFTKQL